MNDRELRELFSGYGYEPYIVEGSNLYKSMFETLEKCYQKIKDIQKRSRKGEVFTPRFPMIILKSPKGWTTIKEIHGQKIEGSILAHQVVMPGVRGDDQELNALEKWLKSYKFDELFDNDKGLSKDILDIIPD